MKIDELTSANSTQMNLDNISMQLINKLVNTCGNSSLNLG